MATVTPKRCRLFVLVLLFVVNQVRAETRTKDLPKNTLSLRMGAVTPTIPLTIENTASSGGSTKPLLYNQNTKPRFGIGADYAWAGFFITFADLSNELNAVTQGTTDYSDFQLHSYMGRLGLDLYYQDFKGYYLQNTQEISGQTCCLLRPDLHTSYIGANIFFLSNPDHMSLVAAGNLTAMQKSGGGSWIYNISFGSQQVDSDAVIAPQGLETSYGRLGNIKNGRLNTITAGAGYGYNFVLGGPWLWHLSMVVGLGPQLQEFHTQDFGSTRTWVMASKGTVRSTIGWSGDRTFFAIQLIGDSTMFTVENASLNFNSVYAFLSGGVRFDI